jgi:dihydroflavonol-4-reductase
MSATTDPPAVRSKATGSGLSVVTGASGHLGNVLVRQLVASGHHVRAVVPPFEDQGQIPGPGVEVVISDVRDRGSLEGALRGARRVFHLAGIVTISTGQRRLLEEVNVRGTRNVVQACLKTGVERLVYTSSVHALGEPGDGSAIREQHEFRPECLFGDYAWSKARASTEIMAAVRQGLNAVMVFPSGIVGPYDHRLSELGTLFLSVLCGRMRVYVDGAYDFVDVRDVADGCMSAMENGRTGQGYILSGNRVTVREMLRELDRYAVRRPFRARAPMWAARTAAAFTPLFYRLTGKKPVLTGYSLRVIGSNCRMDRTKAETELGFRARPFAETVQDTAVWLRETGRLGLPDSHEKRTRLARNPSPAPGPGLV